MFTKKQTRCIMRKNFLLIPLAGALLLTVCLTGCQSKNAATPTPTPLITLTPATTPTPAVTTAPTAMPSNATSPKPTDIVTPTVTPVSTAVATPHITTVP